GLEVREVGVQREYSERCISRLQLPALRRRERDVAVARTTRFCRAGVVDHVAKALIEVRHAELEAVVGETLPEAGLPAARPFGAQRTVSDDETRRVVLEEGGLTERGSDGRAKARAFERTPAGAHAICIELAEALVVVVAHAGGDHRGGEPRAELRVARGVATGRLEDRRELGGPEDAVALRSLVRLLELNARGQDRRIDDRNVGAKIRRASSRAIDRDVVATRRLIRPTRRRVRRNAEARIGATHAPRQLGPEHRALERRERRT